MGELLRLTHPVRTQYQPSLGAWHDAKGAEVASMRVFRTLGAALDMPGLRAVYALLAARTAQMLAAATRFVEGELEAGRHLGLLCRSSILAQRPGFLKVMLPAILAGALPNSFEATHDDHSGARTLIIPLYRDQCLDLAPCQCPLWCDDARYAEHL